MNKSIIWAIVLAVVIVGGVMWSKNLQENDPNLISANGIHWHPTLSIVINGEQQDIPSNIGLVGGHYPIHTHDEVADQRETGEVHENEKPLHLEFGSAVRTEDVRLGNFFDIWGKTFNSECIFDNCNSSESKVSMTVNGEPNTDFEEYIMQDGDRIEIRYE